MPLHGGWTPAHVAVLSNNEAGLNFLSLKGALAKDVADAEGRTPVDLARQYRPELLKFFDHPFNFEFLDKLFSECCVDLPKGPFEYKSHTDDFGVEIKKILLTCPNKDVPDNQKRKDQTTLPLNNIIENIICIGKKFGFEVVLTESQYFPRDTLFDLPDDGVNIINSCDKVEAAVNHYESLSLQTRDKYSSKTNHYSFKAHLGIAGKYLPRAARDLIKIFGKNENQISVVPIYMEGGNLYVLTNSLGKRVVLFGSDTLPIALNQLRLDEMFESESLVPLVQSYYYTYDTHENILSDDKLLIKTLEEMYAQGLFKVDGKTGFLTKAQRAKVTEAGDKLPGYSSSGTNNNLYKDIAIQFGYCSPLKLTEEQKKQAIPLATDYLAKKKVTEDFIANTFNVDLDEIYFVPQLDYHIDLFLRPGPKGSVFVQDYSLCVKLIKEIQNHSKELGLTENDNKMLKRYLLTAEKLNQELGPLCEDVKTKVKASKLHVIPVPGVFYDLSPNLLNPSNPDKAITYNLNFLNAITGYSAKTRSYYYIATGAQVGDHLGRVLMGSFKALMQHIQPGMQIEFIGFDPKNPSDFSEGMRCLNNLGSFMGPHCLSFLMETASHKD